MITVNILMKKNHTRNASTRLTTIKRISMASVESTTERTAMITVAIMAPDSIRLTASANTPLVHAKHCVTPLIVFCLLHQSPGSLPALFVLPHDRLRDGGAHVRRLRHHASGRFRRQLSLGSHSDQLQTSKGFCSDIACRQAENHEDPVMPL